MKTHPIEYVDIPRATFCTPNVASFGLTEQQARDAGMDVVVGKLQYGAVGAGTVYGDRTGVIKIIGDKKYGELVGGHIVGAKATELIQELVNAKALEGGYAEVARIVHGHPTLSEGVMEAARAADGWLIHGIASARPSRPAVLLRPRLPRELPRRRTSAPRGGRGPGVDPGELRLAGVPLRGGGRVLPGGRRAPGRCARRDADPLAGAVPGRRHRPGRRSPPPTRSGSAAAWPSRSRRCARRSRPGVT